MKLILLGPPGSGKGTVSERLEKDFKLLHISAGEMLRDEIEKGTFVGKEIKKYVEKGDLVPDQFVVEIVKLRVKSRDNYILDGFPRSVGQAKAIEDLDMNLVVYLDVPEKVIVERLSGRRVCEKGSHSYHIKYLPPKKTGICDHDGTKLIQRKDDDPKVIKERFKVYRKKTEPLIDFYKKKKLLKTVDGSLSPDEVYSKVKGVVG